VVLQLQYSFLAQQQNSSQKVEEAHFEIFKSIIIFAVLLGTIHLFSFTHITYPVSIDDNHYKQLF